MIASSFGILRVTHEKVWVDVDPNIVYLARALIPPHSRLNPQRYPPHITVVREESFCPPAGADGRIVQFEYDPRVVPGEVYWWLRVSSPELVAFRSSLGLPQSSGLTRPPDGEDCFHITIGNTKCK